MTNNIFSRRLFIVLAVKMLLLFVLVVRLFYLQIKENYYFQGLSEKNRTNLVPIIPKRGIIFDCFADKIADNVFLWEALFIKSQLKQNLDLFVNNISSILNINDSDKARIIKDYKTKPRHFPVLIKQDLSQSEIAALETFSNNLPGVFIRPFYRRYYPYKDVFANLIGYTSLTNDLNKTNNITNWHIGRSGLELQFDNFLRGNVGYAKYEIDAKGSVLRKLDQTSSIPGNNITLTIDNDLQNYTHELLSQYNSASAVVLDLETGAVLTLASYPAFDPNLFAQGIPYDIWDDLINNKKAPLSNKPVNGLYPPGSTIKPIMALKALEKGIIDENTTVDCKGYLDVGDNRFHCWKRKGHGKVNVSTALSESCDIFFYNLAYNLTPEDMSSVAKDFGFGTKLLPTIPTEAKGRLLTDTDERYLLGDRINSVIGQGKWLASPLQLAYMVGIIANDGISMVSPNLLKSLEYNNKVIYPKSTEIPYSLPYKKEYIHLLKQSFLDSVTVKGGTAILARTRDKDWELVGKTGTSQVRRITMKERETGVIPNHKLPWEKRDHALFIGFVPYDKPAYAISVVIEHGGGASLTAAPLAKNIALRLRDRHSLYSEEKAKLTTILKNNNV